MDRLIQCQAQYNIGKISFENIRWLIQTVEEQQREIEKLRTNCEFWMSTSDQFRTALFTSHK